MMVTTAEYEEAISYLYGLQKFGIKLGLENTRRLLALLGNPQQSFCSVHVAGTNGKGSTSAMIASVLAAAGHRVGLFTSPHRVSFTERIRVNDAEIAEREVVAMTQELRSAVDAENSRSGDPVFLPTFFEFVTAMAVLYFKRMGVSWAVVEAGMGGRLDATNVLLPRAAVITRIALDHREYLGETLAAIAAEKAGIIKEGIPLVSAAQGRDAGEVIRNTAAERRAPLFVFGADFAVVRSRVHAAGIALDYRGGGEFRDISVPLPGRHQLENTALALKACELIAREAGLSSESISEGIGKVRWPGRLELITYPEKRYDILVDGAHNPDAAEALAEALKTLYLPLYARILLVLGVMADKDVDGIMGPLLPVSAEVILAAPSYARAATAETLLERASALGFRATAAPSVREALILAAARAATPSMPDGRSLIVITGSFYTIGEAEAALGHVGVLTGLRE